MSDVLTFLVRCKCGHLFMVKEGEAGCCSNCETQIHVTYDRQLKHTYIKAEGGQPNLYKYKKVEVRDVA